MIKLRLLVGVHHGVREGRELRPCRQHVPDEPLHVVESLDVGLFERRRLFPPIPHDEEGETIFGHVDQGELFLLLGSVGGELKVEFSKIIRAVQFLNIPQHVGVSLPKRLRYLAT